MFFGYNSTFTPCTLTGNPLFNHTRGEISRKYPLGITPIREIFTFIWPIIYAFQGIWMGLCIASIFIKTRKIKYVGRRQSSSTSVIKAIFPPTSLTPHDFHFLTRRNETNGIHVSLHPTKRFSSSNVGIVYNWSTRHHCLQSRFRPSINFENY